eukprot:403369629
MYQPINPQTPNVNRFRIINLICLLAYFILFITTAIVNYLTNLYLAIFIASIVFCFINLAYLFAPNLQQKIAAKRFVMVYIPGGIIGPTAIVNFFIRFINWMTNFNYYKQIIGYIVCELFFLLSVFMFSTVFVMYVRKTAPVNQ